ncbi:ferrous iron transport protein A [Blautia sp. An249]|uniref:FeoA family protein n=1 Tax=Blautia sp. An249 TaxID=1965603 RepID=UPI000B38A9E2|nr:FeoA family protein [Blautia sp. An249]OUO80773.1 ferrous iron transport protein A [Blautia sp. An249]
MQPLVFLQSGESGIIKRVGGATETRRFLAGLGFVEDTTVSVISRLNGSLIVNVKDSRVAINEDMARRIMV